jgi:hypothetical protein
VGLSWGRSLSFNDKDLPVHLKLGYRFPDTTLDYTGLSGALKQETKKGGGWLLNGGLSYGLNDVSTLEADLFLGGTLGTSSTGGQSGKTKGDFGLKLAAALGNTFSPADGLEIGLKPNLALAVYGIDPDLSGALTVDGPAETSFEVALGLDAGIKARLPGKFNKFTMITGAGLQILDWRTVGVSGGDGNPKGYSGWELGGIAWKDETLTTASTLGVGTVFAPSDNLSIGLGLSTLLNNLVAVNLKTMEVALGSGFSGAGNVLEGLFKNAELDLTVSFRF